MSDEILYTYNRLYDFVNKKFNPYKTQSEQNEVKFYQNYDIYNYLLSPTAIQTTSLGRIPARMLHNADDKISTSSSAKSPQKMNQPTHIKNWRAFEIHDTVNAWKMKLGKIYNDLAKSNSLILQSIPMEAGLQYKIVVLDSSYNYFGDYNTFKSLAFELISQFSEVSQENIVRKGKTLSLSSFAKAVQDPAKASASSVKVIATSNVAKRGTSNPPSVGCEWFGYFNPSGKSSHMEYKPNDASSNIVETSYKGEYTFKIRTGRGVYFYLWLGDKAICEYTNFNSDMNVDTTTFTLSIEDHTFYPLRIQYFTVYSPNSTSEDNAFAMQITQKSSNRVMDVNQCCYIINKGNYIPPLLYCAFVSTSPAYHAEGMFKCYFYDMQVFINPSNDTNTIMNASKYRNTDYKDLLRFYNLLNQAKYPMQMKRFDNEDGKPSYGELPDGMAFTPVQDNMESLPYVFSIYRISCDLRMGKTFQINKAKPDVLPNGDKIYQIQMINPSLLRYAKSYTEMHDFYPDNAENEIPTSIDNCKTQCNQANDCAYYHTYSKNKIEYCKLGKNNENPSFNQIPSATLRNVDPGSGSLNIRNKQMDAARNCTGISGSPGSVSNTYIDVSGTADYNTYKNFYWNRKNVETIQELGFCSDPEFVKLNNEAKDILLNTRKYKSSGSYFCNGKLVPSSESCTTETFVDKTSAQYDDKDTNALNDTGDVIQNTLKRHDNLGKTMKDINQNYLDLSKDQIPDYKDLRNKLSSNSRYDYNGNQLLYFRNKPIPNKGEKEILDNNEQLVSQNLFYLLGTITAATVIVFAVIIGKE